MMEMYVAVLSEEKAKVFVSQIFTKFDTDDSGEIDFKVSPAFVIILLEFQPFVKL